MKEKIKKFMAQKWAPDNIQTYANGVLTFEREMLSEYFCLFYSVFFSIGFMITFPSTTPLITSISIEELYYNMVYIFVVVQTTLCLLRFMFSEKRSFFILTAQAVGIVLCAINFSCWNQNNFVFYVQPIIFTFIRRIISKGKYENASNL